MKIAIYTSITGNYDELRQPVCIDNRFSYICFSNDFTKNKIGIWEIRKLPLINKDHQRLSRYPKMKPHLLLPEFDYSVYMDANLVIIGKGFYDCIIELINKNKILAGVKNGWRDCLYDEGFRCILSNLDSKLKIIKEMRFIKKEGFPKNYGMYEANVIFRKHHEISVINQCNLWWDIVQQFAKRDQLCYSYTTWKCSIPWCYIFSDESNTHNNPNIKFYEHSHKTKTPRKNNVRKNLKFLKPILKFVYNIIITV